MPAIQLANISNTETVTNTEATTAKPLKLKSLQGAFSHYMQQNSSNTAQAAKQQPAMPQAKANGSGGGADVQQQYEQYQGKAAAQAGKITDTIDANPDAEALNGAIEEAAADIRESIKENLGVDDEQIEAAMQLLGLTAADLLDPQQLTALAVELTGSENAGMMLFNENFQSLMQEVSAITEDLLKDLGMTMEELTEQLVPVQEAVQAEDTRQPEDIPLEEMPDTQPQAKEQETVQAAQAIQAQPATEEAPGHLDRVVMRQEEAAVQPKEAQPQQQAEEAEEPKLYQEDKVQEAQPQQQAQAEGEGTGEGDPAGAFLKNADSQEDPEPGADFHANVHRPEPDANIQAPQDTAAQAPQPQVSIQDVIEQIVEYTRVNLTQDAKTIEMQLNPESLGKVYLHVTEKQGAVTAQITAQDESLKEALVQQAAALKESLTQQGIKVDAVEVTVGTHEFENNLERDAHSQEEQARQQEEQNRRRSRRSINLNDLDGLEGLSGLMSEEEVLAAQIMRDNGNNVDYKA